MPEVALLPRLGLASLVLAALAAASRPPSLRTTSGFCIILRRQAYDLKSYGVDRRAHTLKGLLRLFCWG